MWIPVFDILKEKHPDPRTVSENVFIHYEELPPFNGGNITGGNVELIGKKLQGCTGLWSTTIPQCQDNLLRYGERLREAIAKLAQHLANTIVDWNKIHG